MPIRFGNENDNAQAEFKIHTFDGSKTEIEAGHVSGSAKRHVEIYDDPLGSEGGAALIDAEDATVANSRTSVTQKAIDPSKVWLSGLFAMFSLVVITSVFGVLAKLLSAQSLAAVLISTLFAYSFTGAIVLRLTGNLDNKSFVELMGMTLKRIPQNFKRSSDD